MFDITQRTYQNIQIFMLPGRFCPCFDGLFIWLFGVVIVEQQG